MEKIAFYYKSFLFCFVFLCINYLEIKKRKRKGKKIERNALENKQQRNSPAFQISLPKLYGTSLPTRVLYII